MLITSTLRLVGFALGTAVSLFLFFAVARKRKKTFLDWIVLAAIATGGLWHFSNAWIAFHAAAIGGAAGPWTRFMEGAAETTALLAPACLALAWIAAYRAYRRSPDATQRKFHRAFGATLLLLLLAVLSSPGSAWIVWASLAPLICFAWFVYRYSLFGIFIGRRVVFVITLGAVSALYLFTVRIAADLAEQAFDAFGRIVEIGLIFAAAALWLPLYQWMIRSLSSRTRLYTDFSRRVIEEAVAILDPARQLQFLAGETGKTFSFRSVVLLASPGADPRGNFGAEAVVANPEMLGRLESALRDKRADLIEVRRDNAARALLAGTGFNYIFPLWYEDHLSGILLIDTSPQPHLDENEPILLGLASQIAHAIETCRQVQKRIELEKALARQEHLATLGKVAATVAHEVKNPLSSIKALAQLMAEDSELARYQRDLGYIVSEADRLNQCVQQLLSYSRPATEPDAGVAVSDLLETTSNMLNREYATARIRIERSIDPSLRLTRADPQSLQQIVLNLTLNAIQASAPEGIVRLEARHSNGNVSITVTDDGPGIAPGMREKIFEPFFTTKQKGTGLGLAIVKKNVVHLGGEIHLESPVDQGRGTSVTVTFPAR